MILTCPSCSSRFNVAAGLVPPEGRVVRCSKCSHQWTAMPVVEVAPSSVPLPVDISAVLAASQEVFTETASDTKLPEASPDSNVETLDDDFMKRLEQVIAADATPPKQKPKMTRRVADIKPFNVKPFKYAVPALAALWLVAGYFAYSPGWSNSKTEGLHFVDVTMEREQEGSKARFIIAGSIHNVASEERTVPKVRVVLKNKTDDTLWGREYPVNKTLKAGEVYPFRITNVETNFAASVTNIEVDMGSGMQLMMR